MALCRTQDSAEKVGEAMLRAFEGGAELDATLYRSPVAERGARIVSDPEGAQ